MGGTRSLVFRKAKKVISMSCETTGADPMFSGPKGSKFTANCPKECTAIPLNVIGTAIYTDNSSVCQAAIHFGVLSDAGGEIEIEIEDGKKRYKGSSKNGLNSVDKGEYMRSFSFGGKPGNTCAYFRENYNPADIFENYYNFDYKYNTKGPSEWSFNKHPEKSGSLAFEQATKIKASGNGGYFGTYLLRKGF